MSWVTIAVFAILILFGVSGWRKGIIRTAVSLAAMVVTFIVCVWVTPSLCKNVKENTQVYDNLQKSIYNIKIEDENFNKAAGESLSDEEAIIISISQLEEYAGQIQKNVNDIMKKLNLPESVIGSGDGNGSYMQDVFHVTGNAQVTMKNIMAAVIAAKLAGLALNAIIYIAVFLVVFAILKIVFAVTGVVGRLPLIYQANKILGLAFGILEENENNPVRVLDIQKYVNRQYESCSKKKFMKVLETLVHAMGNDEGFIGDMYACNKKARNYYLDEMIQSFNFVFDEMCHGTGSAANCDFDVEE